MIFVREERPTIVAKHPDAKFTEIGKILGSEWAKLSEAEKKKYDQMSATDRDRYTEELAQYAATHPEDPMSESEEEDGPTKKKLKN